MEKGKINFHFWAMGALGEGLSGSDRIFIELARRWSKKYPITIYVWEEGAQMCRRQHLGNSKPQILNSKQIPNPKSQIHNRSNLQIRVLRMGCWCNFGFVVCYLARILRSVRESFRLKLKNKPTTIVYSASDFWMDSLPAVVLKIRYPKITWVATWYQTAPNPLRGFAEGKRNETHRFKAFLYWFAQLPIKPLIGKFADKVIVNNEDERRQFPEMNKKKKVIVLIGAVRLDEIKKYQSLTISHRPSAKRYDAVFQGRFHPQKGVVELIEIWKKVVDEIPNAKLAMIGDGPLMKSVRSKIKKEKLEKNIKLFGYVFDGPKKYKIFSQSKIVVHPSFYDSGGMASAEAMAFGLPAVGFNLKAYKSYYPKGMIKVKTGDLDAFAKAILKLLKDEKYRQKIGKEAKKMIEDWWSWERRTKETLLKITQGGKDS